MAISRLPSNLNNSKVMSKFRNWMYDNALNVDSISGIDVEAEFGKDLTYDEAIGFALQKFP